MTLRAPCFIVHTNTPLVPAVVSNSASLSSVEDIAAKNSSPVNNDIEGNGVRKLRSEEVISSLLLDKTSEEEEEEEGEESSSDDGYISMKELKKKSVFITPLKEEQKLCSTKEAQKKEKRKLKEEAKNLLVTSVKRDLIEAATDAAGPTSSLPSDRDWGVGSDFSDSDSESKETTKSNRKIQILKEDKEWRLRELRRIKRSKEDRERSQREEELLQSERNLTEEEKKKRDVLKMNRYLKAKGGEMNFMQRYYHKGSFFIGDADGVAAAGGSSSENGTANTSTRAAELMSRDYGSSLTGGDTSTATMQSLPSLKQVRNWGKRSRSKWTHLVEEDTTSFDYGWGQRRNELNYQLVGRMGGMLPKRE